MKRLSIFLMAVVLFSVSSHAQDIGSAPVNWVRYRVSDSNLSLMFPKLPMRENQEDVCRELKSSVYFSYAEGVAYEFGVYAKARWNHRDVCHWRVTKFEQTMRERLAKLRDVKDLPAESVVSVDGRAAIKLATSVSTRWMIADDDRWIEIAVHHYANDKPDIDTFFKSLEWSAKSGAEIGAGSEVVLGDPEPETTVETTPADAKADSTPPVTAQPGSGTVDGKGSLPAVALDAHPYRMIQKPRARYTDQARAKGVQGAVRLKVTLLANGQVGAITTVTTLPHGITENAIAAARRIVFLPKRVNKITVNVIVTLEYTFTIY